MISPLPSKASSTCRSRSVSPIAGNTSLTALSPPRNSSDRAISLPDSPTILAAEPIIAADAIKNLSVAASPNPRTPIAAALAASVSVASPRSADSPAEGKPRSFVQVALWAICLTTTVCVLVALWHGWSMVHAHRVSTASQVGSSTSVQFSVLDLNCVINWFPTLVFYPCRFLRATIPSHRVCTPRLHR